MKNKMYVANLHAVGDLRYESADMPTCEKDEVLLQVMSCGICGSDMGRVFGKGTYHFPTVIGHEFAGRVIYDPQNTLTGKKAVVFPLLPCFQCPSCKSGNYATCSNYDYYGSRRDGGMSEFLAVKRWNILPLPESISFDEGAMCEPIAVARHAVSKLHIKNGDNLLISGAGPIGIIAGQWATSFGAAHVYYIDIDPRKIDFAEKMGFAAYESGVNIHCALEGTGFGDALEKCLAAISPFGRMVLMGNPSREVTLSQNTYWHILRKELQVFGTWNSSFNDVQNDWCEGLAALSDGRINVKPLITHRYPLSACNEAFLMMKEKRECYQKVMLFMHGE